MSLSNQVLGANRLVRIGTLLLRANIVEPETFAAALEHSKQADSPVGAQLVRMEHITEATLSAALHLQTLVAEGLCPLEVAVKALSICERDNLKADVALKQLNWTPTPDEKPDDIEQMMTGSEFITAELYKSIYEINHSAFNIVLQGVLTCSQFNEILKAVSLVRTNAITVDQGIGALKKFKATGKSVEQILREDGMPLRDIGIRLGDMLVTSCIISEADMLVALEMSMRHGTKLGEYLTNNSQVTPEVLDLCLQVQGLTATRIVEPKVAVRIIKECLAQKLKLAQYLNQYRILDEDPMAAQIVTTLLRATQLTTQHDIDAATTMTGKHFMGPTASLVVTGRLTAHLYRCAWQYYALMQQEKLTPQEAVVALHWCQRTGSTAEDALASIRIGQSPPAEEVKAEEEAPAVIEPVAQEEAPAEVIAETPKRVPLLPRLFFLAGLIAFAVASCLTSTFMPEKWHLFSVVCLIAGMVASALMFRPIPKKAVES